MQGLNLLRLLVQNRISEFHTELELIPFQVRGPGRGGRGAGGQERVALRAALHALIHALRDVWDVPAATSEPVRKHSERQLMPRQLTRVCGWPRAGAGRPQHPHAGAAGAVAHGGRVQQGECAWPHLHGRAGQGIRPCVHPIHSCMSQYLYLPGVLSLLVMRHTAAHICAVLHAMPLKAAKALQFDAARFGSRQRVCVFMKGAAACKRCMLARCLGAAALGGERQRSAWPWLRA